jgi:hypothetical protein
MPPVIIASVIAAAAATAKLGADAAGVGQPSTSAQTKAIEDQTKANQQAQLDAKQQAFKTFAPDAQGQTGGALTDKSFSQLVAEMAGNPGDLQLAQNTIFGPGGGSGGPGGGSGPGGSPETSPTSPSMEGAGGGGRPNSLGAGFDFSQYV